MATNVKILLRRGARSEISAGTLDAGELGFSSEEPSATNQLYVGTNDSIDQIVFDPFANAHAIVQTFLDTYTVQEGLEIDEDLIIRNVSDVDALITAMGSATTFDVSIFGRARRNVEVLTENSFSQVFANMHLQSHTAADGKRPDLFKKELLINDGSTPITVGRFLKYAATDSSSFFIDYSLKQVRTVSPAITFIRVGTIIVINGAAVTPAIAQAKLTDTNTEIWQDDGDNVAQADEFSNIEFIADIDDVVRVAGAFVVDVQYKIVTPGTTDFTTIGAADSNVGTIFTATGVGAGDGTVELAVIPMNINYTQDVDFTTEISYTVKRWTM